MPESCQVWWCWVTSRSGWLLELLTELIIHCIVRVPVLTLDGTFDVVGGDKVVKQVFIICVVVEGK